MPNNITVQGGTPYVDDFQTPSEVGGKTPEEKNYLRILYKPGVSVQARELNQMQSMLQAQIDSLGRSTFEDGADVVGGAKQFDDGIYAVDITLNTAVFRPGDSEEGKKHYLDNITTLQYQRDDTNTSPATTNYINATVLHYTELGGGSSGDVRFFVRYDNTIIESDGTEFKTFPSSSANIYYGGADTIGSIITETNRDVALTGVGIISDSPYQPLQDAFNHAPIGTQVTNHQAIIAKVDSGVFFVKGEFVLNDEQEIYLVKPVYDYLANGKLAFKVNEQTITTDLDETLYDNAKGYPNYKAPGADRYAIDLELVFLSDGDAINAGNDKDFVDDNSDVIALSTIDDGDETFSFIEEIQDGKDRIKVSDVLAENITNTLALRTEEESGDYAVEPFIIDVREYYNDTNDSENRGLYTEQQIRDASITVEQGDISGIASTGDVPIGASTPSSPDVEKYGESRMSIGIEPSVAYVDGFRIEATERIDIPVPKARTVERDSAGDEAPVDAVVTAQLGSYIEGNADDSPEGCIFGTPTLGLDVTQATSGATAKIRSIEKIGTKFRLYVYNVSGSFNATNDITGVDSPSTFKFIPSSGIIEPTVSESFITLPYENISTVVASASTFKARRLFNAEVSGLDSVQIEYTVGDGVIFTDEGDGSTYLLQGASDSDPVLPASTAVVTNGTVVDLTFASNHGLTGTVQVLASFECKGSDGALGVKSKTLETNGTKTFSIGTLDNTFANGGLGKVDVVKILSAIETHDDPSSPADSPVGTVQNNITSDLELDDGQRDGIYKQSRIRYTGSLDLSASTVVVTFEYFSRTPGAKEIYTVNSYTNVDYKDIPSYKDIRLSDIIDFRPDETINGVTNTGVSATSFFDPNSVIQTQVNYYLNRIDVVVVNSIGEFNVIQGTPGLYPDQPAIPDNAMHLYTVNVPAYTFDIKDIENEYIDNRRYTMRDIGDLESRIKNIEYFNTLSMLEKDASSKQITDDTGMERFKNGIVVDSFLGHGTADTFDPGYSASVDKEEGLMRPAFGETNNRFVLENAGTIGNRPDGIHLDGMATLPFEYGTDEVALINQDKASMHMSVNPYAVAAWWGEVKLSPSSDQWKETSQRPDVLVNRENDTAVLRNIRNGLRAQGTIWGSWRTNWVGRFRWTRTNTRRRFGRGRRLFVGFRFGRSIRRGLRTTARIETVRTTVNNRVVDTSFVPFIRSRRVYFTGKLFRPNTKLHLYFDGVDISSYATKAPFVQFADNQDTRSFLDQTDTQIFDDLGTRQELITDDAGSIDGYFIVPNNSANKFRTGEREVKLCDSATGASANDSTTEASVNYSATGIIQHRQRTIVSTRRVILRREWVRRRRNVRGRRRRRWRDPLAQSFMIGEIDEGIFATSVDLYFQRKSNNVPVQMYVVTTDNGYPSQEIIPGSEITLMPEDVSISDNATAVTNFRFDSPIYLSPGVEYAIVVLSNDDNYRMWLSDIGKEDVTTGEMIVKNPYTGVMFKSQNASTWTADQNKDFKFKLNRANFTTANQTKDWEFKILADTTLNPADIFHQAMLQSEEVNLPQTSIRYQLALNGTDYVDVTPGEEYYEGATITDGAIKLKATLTTSSNFVTPLLDLDRLGLAGVFNIVNSEDNLIDTDASPDLDTETNANHGTAEARYITQEVSLANPADQITTFLEINRPIVGSNVRVYIRTKTGEENITENGFTRVLPKSGNPIPVNGDRDEFEEVEFEALNLALFQSFQVKIVMTSSDKEYVPVVKSLRSIATT